MLDCVYAPLRVCSSCVYAELYAYTVYARLVFLQVGGVSALHQHAPGCAATLTAQTYGYLLRISIVLNKSDSQKSVCKIEA